MPPMTPKKGEEPQGFADRVQNAMQDTMTAMTAKRKPILG